MIASVLHMTPCSMEAWSSHVCLVFGTLCDFMGNELPFYENISKCLLLDKKKLMNRSCVQCIYGNALPIYLNEINKKNKSLISSEEL